MYRLSSIILFLLGTLPFLAQSPHGEALKIDCAQCHNPAGWNIEVNDIKFDHDKTNFALEGTHNQTDCKLCHSSFIFDEAPSDCISCHQDMHSMSVGNDCIRCHTSESWLVFNIPEIHEENGFPLIGTHSSLSCDECHLSEPELRFDRIGNECINCHMDDYLSTQNPNHPSSGISTECTDCHNPFVNGWETDFIDHEFFPLTSGHDIQGCNECHTSGNFSDANPDCVSCHLVDYNQTSNPNHPAADFQTDCVSCHTTNPGWMPATFDHDEQFFPIYSGEHAGEWNDCIECHINPSNYSIFSCTTCHTNPETDDEHNGVSGYVFESNACFACHPTGNADEGFNHNNTAFLLTGGHLGLDCLECHSGGYVGTPTDCQACHLNDYNSTTNPNHNSSGISTDCVMCHTTNPGWMPASFDHNNTDFPLTGAHIGQDCLECHSGGYAGTPTDCQACHLNDYNNTTNPDHDVAGIPTDCVMCHTTNPGWMPASFDHNNTDFPLTGAHIGQDCLECHSGGYAGTPTDCQACHLNDYNNTTNPDHDAAGIPTDCIICHTTNPGWMPASFDHNNTDFPLTGAHIGQNCLECHSNGYPGTPTDCFACHANDYNNSTNPNHSGAQFPTDCAICHTTNPGWTPANFDHDGQYFPIYSGRHQGEWNQCTECHINSNNYAVFTCVTCHTQSQTGNDHDGVLGYVYESNACFSCHPNP